MIYLELLLIASIIVFGVDLTDFPNNIKKFIMWCITLGKSTRTNYRIHLIDCSLCIIHWVGILYLVIMDEFTIVHYAFVCLLALFSDVIGGFIMFVKDLLISVLERLKTKVFD